MGTIRETPEAMHLPDHDEAVESVKQRSNVGGETERVHLDEHLQREQDDEEKVGNS